MVMEVFDDRITLERRDFEYGLRLGPDWTIPLGDPSDRPYRPEPRAAASRPPQFAPGAAVSVRRIAAGKDRAGRAHPQVEVAFPPVNGRDGGVRAFDFQVDCESRISGVVRTVASSRVYSPNALLPEEKDVAPVTCRFAAEAIPDCGEVRFTVRPVNEWGKSGTAIATGRTPALRRTAFGV